VKPSESAHERLSQAAPRPGTVREQFGNPTGTLGRLIGLVMGLKNGTRGRWVLSVLALRPSHRVLEIGFGSGHDIQRACRLVSEGSVAGVDHSEEMVRMARRRNAVEARSGKVDLRLGSATALPFGDTQFDRVFSINSVQFWEDLRAGLREVRRVLRPGGRAAIAIQPRSKGATMETTREWGQRLRDAMTAVGFDEIREEMAPLRPVPVVCVLGTRRAE
jgi:ubiquinone/menaquinone biosynthesis C-methylase UbiE